MQILLIQQIQQVPNFLRCCKYHNHIEKLCFFGLWIDAHMANLFSVIQILINK